MPPVSGRRRQAQAVHEVCPYLRSEAGSWRSAYAAREHRCGALHPPAQLAVAKQRSLCLVSGHQVCATYLAASALAAETLSGPQSEDGAALWPQIRSSLLVLEPTRGLLASFPRGSTRAGGQALLAGLMVLAFLALIVARTTAPPGSASPGPVSSASVVVVVPLASGIPSASPGPTGTSLSSGAPSASITPSASPSATPGATAPPTPIPSGAVTYTVKPGDTLSGIAARFNTSVKAIQAANNIADPRVIRSGQVLVIP
jgi:LysM repeat protein